MTTRLNPLTVSLLVVLPVEAALAVVATSESALPISESLHYYKLSIVAIIAIFLPLTAITYYWFRRYRRSIEIDRILRILQVDDEYRKSHKLNTPNLRAPGVHYIISVLYTSVLATVGLCVLFLGPELDISEFPNLEFGTNAFPQKGSRLVFGMAFLGGYLWGVQNILHRYMLNDLSPAVYYGLSLRMLMAATTALVIFNASEALVGDGGATSNLADTVWPALAFMLGMFPQRGLRWLTRRLPIIAPTSNPTVEEIPIEMIQGMNVHDQLRLEEVGIQTCYGLANADFVPLMLKTPYGARELVDWILQAKLCVRFGAGVKDLRMHGIRTIIDLRNFEEDELKELAAETLVTTTALLQARELVLENKEVDRLLCACKLLSEYWGSESQLDSINKPSPNPVAN